MTVDHSTESHKKTLNRLQAPVWWMLVCWCEENHQRLAELRVTRQQAAQMAMEELAPQLERIRLEKRLARPILFKPSNIKAAYKAAKLVWHRGSGGKADTAAV